MQNNLPSVQIFYLLHEGEGIHSTKMISEAMNVAFLNRRQSPSICFMRLQKLLMSTPINQMRLKVAVPNCLGHEV